MTRPTAPSNAPADAALATVRHATCIAAHGRALLIEGPAGSGKSSLALDLMALGAELVADDRTALRRSGESPPRIWAAAPPGLPALVEARGLGLLAVVFAQPAPVFAAVRLGQPGARLPAPTAMDLLGVAIPRFDLPARPHAAAALWQILRSGMVPQWA